MLEIIVLFRLGRNIAARARDKGRRGTPFVLLLLALWFGGEIVGAVAGVVLSQVLNGRREPSALLIYVVALAFATIGAVIAFKVVNSQAAPGEPAAPASQTSTNFSKLPKFQP